MADIIVKTKVKAKASAKEIFETILHSRGYTTKAKQTEFLNPPVPTLALLLKATGIKKSHLAKAQGILNTHLKAGHDICVFGDYDADGVTACAIMWQGLTAYAKVQQSSSRILPFIPDRHKHGYGLGDQAVSEVISGEAFGATKHAAFVPRLVITVDTGIVAHDGIKTFKEAGLDVIVSDHHLPENGLLPANCIVHSTATSGAGVAWIFVLHLLGDTAMKLIDLATIGIVGDMMPLTGLNRLICATGLDVLSRTKRPGIVAMKQAMGISDKAISTYDISFGLAPRINAAGRIYSPWDALRLLCTSDSKLAGELAAKIESHNKDRQVYTDRALKLAASESIKHKIIVVTGDFHEGIIGLVAGKLTEMYSRPAVVMSLNGDIIKGSARSVPGVNITSLLRSLSTPYLGLGGHDQAAGFSLKHNLLSSMKSELEKLGDKTIDEHLLVKHVTADLELPLASATMTLSQMIESLSPFGMGNPKPKLLFTNLKVLEDRKLGSKGEHRKLLVEQAGTTRELMLFNTTHPYPLHSLSSAVCTLDINTWRDKQSLQLIASYVET